MSLSNRPIPYNYSEICMYEEAMQSKQYENYTHVNVPPFTIVHTFYEKLREATVVKFFSH